MNNQYYCYKLIYKSNRSHFLRLLTGKSKAIKSIGGHDKYRMSLPVSRLTIHGELVKTAESIWPQSLLTWRRLEGVHEHAVLEIALETGKYIIVRNGSNAGRYNFAILTPAKEFHFTQNVSEATSLVELLNCPRLDLPLWFGRLPLIPNADSRARLTNLFEKRLKSTY